MTETQMPPGAEEKFASLARATLAHEERSWGWLSRQTDIHVNTLRSQLLEKPSRLKLTTARRVATALDISVWGEDA